MLAGRRAPCPHQHLCLPPHAACCVVQEHGRWQDPEPEEEGEAVPAAAATA